MTAKVLPTKNKQWLTLTKLWQQSASDWLDFLKASGAEKPSLSGPTRLKLCCPYHGDSTPSATIYIDRGYFRCYSLSCCKFVKDPISLASQLLGRPYLDAFEVFRSSFSLGNKIKTEDIKVFDEAALRRRRMALLSDCFHAYACQCWTANNNTESATNTVNWLRKVRGIKDISSINTLGMFPKTYDLQKLLLAKGSEEDKNWAMSFLGKYLDLENVDSVVFMYATAPGTYSAFKLRKPLSDKKKSIVYIRDDSEELGFFGLANAAYASLIGDPSFSNVSFVEGEFDQISLYQGQVVKGLIDNVFLATGGSGHAGLDGLTAIGINCANIIGDNDEAGEDYPTQLLAKSSKMGCRIFSWPSTLHNPLGGKIDPDEAVKVHGFDAVYKELANDNNYRLPARWCYDRAMAALKETPTDDVRKQQDIAIQFGSLLHNTAELHAYAEMICADLPLLTQASIFHGVSLDDDTEIGFNARIKEAFKRIFHVISVDRSENILTLWHKEKRALVKVRPGSVEAVSILTSLIGTPWIWLKEQVGLPSYFPDVEGENGVSTPLTRTHTMVTHLFGYALADLAKEAPDFNWETRSQGLHLCGVETPDQPGYLVNGDRVFKMTWNEEGTELKTVAELPGPSDGTVVFDPQPKDILVHRNSKWVPWLDSENSLRRKPTQSIGSCYEQVYNIINTTCGFRYQHVDTTYVALHVFYSYVADAIRRKVLTHILGEHESGKSTLLSLIAGYSQVAEFSLTHHAHTMDVYTRAGVFTKFHGTRLVIGLDEANDHDDGSKTSMTLQELLQKLRGLIGGIAKYNMGSKDGSDTHAAYLCNPVIMAGATPMHDPMNASRFTSIELVKDPTKKNSRSQLNQKFGKARVETLRDDIFLHMLNLAPRVAREYERAWEAYGDGNKLPQEMDRFVEGLLPLVAVGNVIGMDTNAFITEFCLTRKSSVSERKALTTGQELFETLINSPQLELDVTTGPRTKSLRVALSRSDLRALINTSSSGVYYDRLTNVIAVAWPQTKASLLKNTVYAKMHDGSLAKTARTCQYYVDPAQGEQTGALARLRAAGLAGSTFYSLFNINYIIADMDAARAEVEAQTPLPVNNDGSKPKVETSSQLPGVNL